MERSQDLTMWSGSGAEGDALAFKKRLGKRASGIAFGEDRLQTPVAVVTIGARKPPLIVGGLPPAGVSKRSPPRSPHVITLRPMSDSAPLYLDSAPPKFKMSATRAGSGAAVLARPRRRRRRRVRMPEVADPVNVQSSSSSSSSSSCSCPGSCACSPKCIRSLSISVFSSVGESSSRTACGEALISVQAWLKDLEPFVRTGTTAPALTSPTVTGSPMRGDMPCPEPCDE